MALVKVIRLGSRIVRRTALCLLGSAALLNIESALAVSLSVLVSLAVYAVAFGLEFSLGFIVLLFLHELGHMIAARVVGVSSKGPMFVPFVGAVIHLIPLLNLKDTRFQIEPAKQPDRAVLILHFYAAWCRAYRGE